jgi:starch synthase (maltosyl-transferring)
VAVDLLIGAELVEAAVERAGAAGRERLAALGETLRAGGEEAVEVALSEELAALMARFPDRRFASRYERELAVVVDRKLARFGAWYELFPRSCSDIPGKHGTFKDVEKRLPYVASMSFDILYLPPIHPIGESFRKGPNNTTTAAPGDVGSPWAIGSSLGGHKAVHPELGTLEDFRSLVQAARQYEHRDRPRHCLPVRARPPLR